MAPTNFSYTVQIVSKECRVPGMYSHFLYEYEEEGGSIKM